MTRREAIKYILVRSLGNFLVLFALYGVIATFGPALTQEARFRIAEARGVRYEVLKEPNGTQETKEGSKLSVPSGSSVPSEPSSSGFAEVLTGEKKQKLTPKDTEFSILIPKIGASAKVYPNVDPGNPEEFLEVLQEGVAHAKGGVFPGLKGNTYLFAHSTDNWWHVGRYNAVFYLLKDVSVGDEIVILFEGKRYDYVVTETKITDPTDVSLLRSQQREKEQLVLQTCWPPGTTWKRLFVIAEPNSQSTN